MKKNYFLQLLTCVVITFLLKPSFSSAQPYIDVLNIKYRSFSSTVSAGDNRIINTGNMSEVAFLLPVQTKNKNAFLIGGDYSGFSFNQVSKSGNRYNLYSASMQMGYDQQLKNEKWRRTVLFIPKFNGDFRGLDKSFQPGAYVMYSYKKKENLKYHFGLYYNRECFGDYFIPLVGIDWKVNSKINLFGDLPNNLSLEASVSPALKLGAGFTTNIASYRVHENNSVAYFREGDNTFGHDQVKIYLNCYLSKNIVGFGEAGEAFNRKYTAYTSDNKEIYNSEFSSGNGMFFACGLAYRFEVE